DRRSPENLPELIARERQLAPSPRFARPCDTILPAHVIPGVHADLEPATRDLLHLEAATAADARTGKQHSIEQGLQSVVLEHGGALHLAEKPAAECAPDRTPGVIGPEAEEKSGAHTKTLEDGGEVHGALARAAVRIHIDLERDERHGSAQRQRLPRQFCAEHREIDRSARAHRREQPQRPAISARQVALPAAAEEPGTPRRVSVWAQTRAVNLPALATDVAERPGERRRARPHEVVDLQRRPRPVDASVFGPPTAEVFTRQDRLQPARGGAGDERRE